MLHIIETYVPENVDELGTGMQRIIVSNIIKMNSESNNKDATILLFEEPEANMHPEAIADMSYNLREFAKKDNQQVIATTHSSQLVSEDIMDMRGLIRVEKQNGLTKIYQNNIPDTELESAKNIVYFDRPRSDIFFARKVILVEGPTEYRLYNYLKQRGDLPRSLTQNVTVVDTVGKWAMPYFQKILNNYNIRHSVLYDTDGDPNRPDNIAVKSEFSELTDYSYGFPRDIETFCGIQKKGNPAINIIKCFQDGTVSQEKQAEVVGIFKNLIMRKQK
jgi:predicted ATP-dependent endonuclease of OLD family